MNNRSNPSKKGFRAFGLALVASLALTGLLASSASALSMNPVPAMGPGAGATYYFQASGGATYSCEKNRFSWESTSPTGGNIPEYRLEGCKIVVLGFPVKCTSAGQSIAGTVVLSKLNYTLVYLDAAKTKFGLKLTPTSGNFAEFTCGNGSSYTWTGSVLGQITYPPLNTYTTQFNFEFTATGSSQTYQQVEGAGTAYHLWQSQNGGSPVPLGINAQYGVGTGHALQFQP